MNKRNHNKPVDKKKLLREVDHLTRPPRLEGTVKEAMMQSHKKKGQLRSTKRDVQK